MGRSVDHLLSDCYLGQLSPYLKISSLKTLPICTHLKINPLMKIIKKVFSKEVLNCAQKHFALSLHEDITVCGPFLLQLHSLKNR